MRGGVYTCNEVSLQKSEEAARVSEFAKDPATGAAIVGAAWIGTDGCATGDLACIY